MAALHHLDRGFLRAFLPLLGFAFACEPNPESDGGVTGAVGVTRAALTIEIDTCAELQAMENDRDGDYVLTSDVSCTSFDAGDGLGFRPVGTGGPTQLPFTGTFDGNGHVITGLTINRQWTNFVGLFGLTYQAQIQEVGVQSAAINGYQGVGGVVGVAMNTNISQVFVTGSVTANSGVGGLVGELKASTLVDSYTTAAVTRNGSVIGLAVGAVTNSGSTSQAYSAGTQNAGTIALAGAISSGGAVTSSFYDCTVAGNCSGSGAAATSAMQTETQYTAAGWDFTNVWGFFAANTYPCLRWQSGCGLTEPDTDGDGTPDATDGCDEDPLKIEEGECGCGVAETSPECVAGSPCTSAIECSDRAMDSLDWWCGNGLPGGFCYVECDANGECPEGLICLDLICVPPCGEDDSCIRPELICNPVPGDPPSEPFCRPTCDQPCEEGFRCDAETEFCVPCEPGPDLCDGIDSDCDLSTDESHSPTATSCGVGACARTGAIVCQAGQQVDSCSPGNPAASDATCDGVDDNCDGQADEQYASQLITCGVGACASSKTTTCVSGMEDATCIPGTAEPTDETCNGQDDDCDGQTDEGVPANQLPCVVEICGNTLDDDGDQLFDCADHDCAGDPICQEPPPRAADVAPALSTERPVSLFESTRFLYAGPSPVQRFADPDAFVPARVALLIGRVNDSEGEPLPGVSVRALSHSEFGESMTDADGAFFMVVNGAEHITLEYSLHSHARVHRKVRSMWNETVVVDDVVMTAYDLAAEAVALDGTATAIQEVRGSLVMDEDGTRQATVLMPPGIEAQMRMPDGSYAPLTNATARITEYTVGPHGQEAMVAQLPANTGYTYAAEFSFDEALEAGADSVEFSEPVVVYLENFVGAPVGSTVPVGYYDRTGDRLAFANAGWVAEEDGIVLEVVSESGGAATVDLNGDGTAEVGADLTAYGITAAELERVATLYDPGQELWRVQMTHFSPYDYNFLNPFLSRLALDPIPPSDATKGDCENYATGSRIACFAQSLGETIPLAGTSLRLHYESNKHAHEKLSLDVVAQATSHPLLRHVKARLSVAGRRFEQEIALPIASYTETVTFEYDGNDAFGRRLAGAVEASAAICHGYDMRAMGLTPSDSRSWSRWAEMAGVAASFSPRSGTIEFCRWLPTTFTVPITGPVGGWDIDAHHTLDPIGQRIYKGDGTSQRQSGVYPLTTAAAGRPGPAGYGCSYCLYSQSDYQCGVGETENPAGADIVVPERMTIAPDGTMFVAETQYVVKIRPNGASSRIFGRLTTNTKPGTQVSPILIYGLAYGPDDMLYVAFAEAAAPISIGGGLSSAVFRVALDGSSVQRVAGSINGTLDDHGPATNAFLRELAGISFSPDGSLYIAEHHRVRRVTPDGLIQTVAGQRDRHPNVSIRPVQLDIYGTDVVHGIEAADADFGPYIQDIAVADDGDVFFIAEGEIFVVGVDGILRLVSGGTLWAGPGVAGSAVPNMGWYSRLALGPGPSPTVYALGGESAFGGDGMPVAWEIAAGRKTAFATAGSLPPNFRYVPGQTANYSVLNARSIALTPDGNPVIGDQGNCRVMKVWNRSVPSIERIVSDDGAEVWHFENGVHARTTDTLLGLTRYAFEYDADGKLSAISDGYGNTTTLVRNAAGEPTAITPPLAGTTLVSVDGLGRLDDVEGPDGAMYDLEYHGFSPALASFEDPTGATSTFLYDDEWRLEADSDAEGHTQTLARSRYHDFDDETDYVEIERTQPGVSIPWSYREDVRDPRYSANLVRDPSGAMSVSTSSPILGVDESVAPDGTERTSLMSVDPRLGTPYAYRTTTRLPSGLTNVVTESRTFTAISPTDPLNASQLTRSTTVSGRGTWTESLDVASKTLTIVSPEGRQRTTTFDAMGRVSSGSIPGLHPISRTYDDRGRLKTVAIGTQIEQRLWTFNYDPSSGYLETIDSPLAPSMTAFERDEVGRATSIESADGAIVGIAYDEAGRITSLTPPGQPPHLFSYSGRGELETVTFPETFPGEARTLAQSYRPDRQLQTSIDVDGATTTRAYDSASGKLMTITTPTDVLSLGYDEASQLLDELTLTDSTGFRTVTRNADGALLSSETWGGSPGFTSGSVAHAYDQAFQLSAIILNGNAVADYDYDQDGLLVQANEMSLERDPSNGFLRGTEVGLVETEMQPNAFGELMTHAVTINDAALYVEQVVERDEIGRIVQQHEITHDGPAVESTRNFEYDLAGRLQTVWANGTPTASYEYDDNGNRTASVTNGGTRIVGRYDEQDRLRRYCTEDANGDASPTAGFPCLEYEYTPRGSVETKTELHSNAQTIYEYDSRGELRRVELPQGTVIEYEVDPLGRRIGKWKNNTKQWGMLYSASKRPVAIVDSSNDISAVFIYASKGHVPDLMVTSDAVLRFVTDTRGSVRFVVNAMTGEVAQSMEYDEFGNVLSDTNPGYQPFGFAGGLYDADTGLVRFGARDYDAVTGRWTAKDPILFAGRQTNLYAYVSNDPINFIDPSGLYTTVTIWDPVGIGESSFGHVSVDVNGTAYSFGPSGMHVEPAMYYEQRNEQFRGGTVYNLNLSPELEEALDHYLRRPQGDYDFLQNNCGDPIERFVRDAFGTGRGDSVDKLTPAALGGLLERSGLLEGIRRVEPWNP